MDVSLTPETLLIFLVFVGVLVISYKFFKFVTKAVVVASISFAFPWIVKILNLPLPIEANIKTAVEFMLLGLAVFIIYEFWHLVKAAISFILKPIRWVLKRVF